MLCRLVVEKVDMNGWRALATRVIPPASLTKQFLFHTSFSLPIRLELESAHQFFIAYQLYMLRLLTEI